MPEATGLLRSRLLGFAHHVRDPARHAAPPGIEERRLRIYRELFLASMDGLLATSFPVIRGTLGAGPWQALVRAFYTGHRCATPLFAEVAGEFVDWLAARDPAPSGDPPWLAELAHYEWIELDLQLHEPCGSRFSGDPDSPLKRLPQDGLRVSALARPLAYAWPVHRIGPDWQPPARPEAPTLLLVRRDADGDVRFSELSPPVFRLLQLLDGGSSAQDPGPVLDTLAVEAGRPGDDAFIAEGEAMLQRLLDEGTLVRGA